MASRCGPARYRRPPIEGASELLVEGSSFEYCPSEVDIAAGEAVNVVLSSSDIEHDFTIDEADFQVTTGGWQDGRDRLAA
jgi:plastocyanin